MAALLDNLDLLAKRDFAALKRLCGVDDEDLAEMVAEIRRLDPKPGRASAAAPVQTRGARRLSCAPAPDGGWQVELNTDACRACWSTRATTPGSSRGGEAETGQDLRLRLPADRQLAGQEPGPAGRTILKVATEIVRQQDAFLRLRRRAPAAAEPEDRRRRHRHARIDRLPGHLEQVHRHAARRRSR